MEGWIGEGGREMEVWIGEGGEVRDFDRGRGEGEVWVGEGGRFGLGKGKEGTEVSI